MESDNPTIFYAYNLNLFLKHDGIGKSLPFTVNTHLEENAIDICDGYSLVDKKRVCYKHTIIEAFSHTDPFPPLDGSIVDNNKAGQPRILMKPIMKPSMTYTTTVPRMKTMSRK